MPRFISTWAAIGRILPAGVTRRSGISGRPWPSSLISRRRAMRSGACGLRRGRVGATRRPACPPTARAGRGPETQPRLRPGVSTPAMQGGQPHTAMSVSAASRVRRAPVELAGQAAFWSDTACGTSAVGDGSDPTTGPLASRRRKGRVAASSRWAAAGPLFAAGGCLRTASGQPHPRTRQGSNRGCRIYRRPGSPIIIRRRHGRSRNLPGRPGRGNVLTLPDTDCGSGGLRAGAHDLGRPPSPPFRDRRPDRRGTSPRQSRRPPWQPAAAPTQKPPGFTVFAGRFSIGRGIRRRAKIVLVRRAPTAADTN
jgi:hypothetical protein